MAPATKSLGLSKSPKMTKNARLPRWRETKGELAFKKALRRIWKETELTYKSMFDFILFYKPKDRFDKWFHVAEMIIVYIILQFAWIGLLGRF